MPYIIDGHNLIPHVHGMSLKKMDDEMELIQRLETFCRIRRQSVEVYFDKAVPGKAGTANFGMVKAVFVSQKSNADAAIKDRLKKLGRKARNWKVVSSDHQVQAEARFNQAKVVESDEFAIILEDTLIRSQKNPTDQTGLSEEEVNAWLEMFRREKPDSVN